MSRNYYQPSNHQFPSYSNTMVPTSYQKVETLYPDYSVGPLVENDCGCPGTIPRNKSHRTVYNLNQSAQIHPQLDKYFVYEQAPVSESETVTAVDKDSTEYVEKILRKSPEAWKQYLTGRFDVLSCLEDGCKRIILKEKVPNKKITDTSGYDIKKYRVRISHHHRKTKKNDEILLVTYENPNSKSCSRSKSYARTISNSKFVVKAPSVRSSSCSSFESTGEYICDVAAVAGVAGPGSELIAKLIEGDDEDIVEIMKPKLPRTAQKLEENVGRDLVGNYFLDSNDQDIPDLQTPVQDEQQQEFQQEAQEDFQEEIYDENYQEELTEEQHVPEEEYDETYDEQEPNVDSFDEDYIEQFAPQEQTKSSSTRKTASKQESIASSRKNDRLTGSVKKALHVFNEFDDSQIYSSPKTISKTSKTSQSEQEVEVYNLSPLPSPVNLQPQKSRSIKSETPLSLASSKLSQISSKQSVSNRLFSNTSSTVTPAPPNPFAFGQNSPVSQSQYADLTGVTDERQTPVYTESIASKQSKISRNTRTSSYRQSNATVREEDEDEKTYTENSYRSSNDYRQSESSSRRSKNKKGSSAFIEYQQSGSNKKEKTSRKKKN